MTVYLIDCVRFSIDLEGSNGRVSDQPEHREVQVCIHGVGASDAEAANHSIDSNQRHSLMLSSSALVPNHSLSRESLESLILHSTHTDTAPVKRRATNEPLDGDPVVPILRHLGCRRVGATILIKESDIERSHSDWTLECHSQATRTWC